MALREALAGVLETIASCEAAMMAIEKLLAAFAKRDPRSQRLQQASGIGLLTATALSASVGEFDRFPSGRHFASALGLTPREHSSGARRQLGRITKRGDTYLRMLLIHGARAALRAAKATRKKGAPLDATQSWVLALAERDSATTRPPSPWPTRLRDGSGPPSITADPSTRTTSAHALRRSPTNPSCVGRASPHGTARRSPERTSR
jgi:transposase